MRVVSRAGGYVANLKVQIAKKVTLRWQRKKEFKTLLEQLTQYNRNYSAFAMVVAEDSRSDPTVPIRGHLRCRQSYGKHLGMKVKVVSRQKYRAIGVILKLPLTPLFENKVQRYQWFKGRGSRGSVAPT